MPPKPPIVRRNHETGELEVEGTEMRPLGEIAAKVVDGLYPIDQERLSEYFAQVLAELTGEDINRDAIERRLIDAAARVRRQVDEALIKAMVGFFCGELVG